MEFTKTQRPFQWKKIQPYLFISPFFIMFAVFGLYPLISGIIISLQDKGVFAGPANYIKLAGDKLFAKSIANAFLYTLGSVFIILPVALGAALLLNSKRMGAKSGAVSTIFFFPNITSVIVVGIVFKFIFRERGGVLNAILGFFSLGPFNFLSNPRYGIGVMVAIGIWRYFGVNSLYFLSGLQGIPVELGEAARIDGANPWQEFWRIIFPLLQPISKFIVFTAITGSFAMFGDVITLVGYVGGTRYSYLYPVMHLYNTMFRENQVNYAAAVGYIIALILLILTTLQRKVIIRDEGEGLV
ncbi:sugar ABC transporter permease [Treponema sp. TIM-1]|uniref:carbohydrate ABC transporter permease n=1 Tax=Treponema sp. TIM-1 TaxID=2898417 RepID=UPI003980BDE6